MRVNSVRFNRELTEHPSRIQILATGPRKIPPTAQHHTLKNSYWMLRSWLKIMNHRCVWERLNMHACHEPRFKFILTWNPPKKNPKFQFFANFSNFLAVTLKKNLQFCLHSFHIWHKSSLPSEGVSHVMTFDLDGYFQGHSALTLKIVSTL